MKRGYKMGFRTDLALERREMLGDSRIEGVELTREDNPDANVTVIEVKNEAGAKALNKPVGKYITVEMDSLPDVSALSDGRFEAIKNSLEELIPEDGTVLVAGLGNTEITPDALGPECAGMILATRHIGSEEQEKMKLPRLRSVAAIAPGVTGRTGIETTEIIACITKEIKPSCIIAVDALAAKNASRVAKTVQICNTGIEPGGGVGNSRKALNMDTLGVPVIAVGIPTVIDAVSIACDVAGEFTPDEEKIKMYSSMMVTPRDTDIITQSASKLIALAINCAVQKNLSAEDVLSLM